MDIEDWVRARAGALIGISSVMLGVGVAAPGCAEFDTTPIAVERGTLGEEIYQVFCERMAADGERSRPPGEPRDVTGTRWKPVCEGREAPPPEASPRLVALHQNRPRLVEALDRTLPESIGDELGGFLGELLPFFDPPEERLPTQTRRLADFLMRLSNDPEALGALERLGTRQGYRPLRLALGVTRPTLAYPQFDQFADLALQTILEGAAAEELTAIQRAAALEMATLAPAEPPVAGERTSLELMRELMFTQDELFATEAPRWVLLRDPRGLASTVPDAGGAVAAPFVDADSDGLPDIDELGRFVSRGGDVAALPTPFPILGEVGVPRDGTGRALRPDGTRYFQYVDASRTMLAGMTAEMAPFFDPEAPTLMRMSRGLPLLLGPEVETAQAYGAHTLRYTAFDDQQGSLFDAVAALGEMMHRDETTDALFVTEALMRDHESETAGVLRAARYLANQADLHPQARLAQPSNLWDDLIALLVRMSQRPGMLEAVMRSFSDPRSAQLGEIYGGFMRHRDRVTYDPSAPGGEPIGLPLDQPVDRGRPDTFDNESLWQRTVALIDALNGVEVCNKEGARLDLTVEVFGFSFDLTYPLFGGSAGRCELIRIPNVAEAYARAILGEYELEMQDGLLQAIVDFSVDARIDVDAALEESSGIPGLTRHPTPSALNRLVFWGLADDSGVRSCVAGGPGDAGNCNSDFVGQLFEPVVDRHGNLLIERYHGTIFAWEQPGFYSGMRPMVEVLHRPGYTYDEGGRYFFGDLLATIHQHWASRENGQTCGPDDGCALGDRNFSYQSDGRSYEALLADGFVDGQLVSRLHRLNLALEAIEVRPGVDGVAALAAAGEAMIDPARNAGLTDRRGRSSATVNDGSRAVPMTPLYLLLEAFDAMDRDLGADPERLRDWRGARHSLAEQLLGTRTLGEGFRMENQRARAVLVTALPFMRERIQDHRERGDLLEWSTGMDERLADTMREPLFAGLIHLLDAVNDDLEARTALAELLGYLVSEASENDAFASTLYGAADALMVLEDDRNIVPLMHALSASMAPNVREVVASGGELDIEGSAVRDSLALVRDIQAVDDERVLRTILQSVVSLPAAGDETTPLETIIDVIAEVNRAAPNEGTPLRVNDYRSVIGQTTDFILDSDHGLERLNALVQQRSCLPEAGLACGAAGERMASRGQCYPGAMCTCAESAGALVWQCQRP